MSFLAIFISIFAERYGGSLADHRRFEPLRRFALHLAYSNPVFNGYFGVAFVVLGIGLLIGFVDLHLNNWWILFNLIFNALALYACLGPRPFYEQAKTAATLLTENKRDEAIVCVESFTGRPLSDEEKDNLPRIIAEQTLAMTNVRILGPVFWFLLFGPMGAWIYRATEQIRLTSDDENGVNIVIHSAAEKIFSFLNWAPSRLVAFTFLLVGNYVSGYRHIKELRALELTHQFVDNDQYVVSVGLGSLGVDIDERQNVNELPTLEVLALIRRTVLVWIGLIALITLAAG